MKRYIRKVTSKKTPLWVVVVVSLFALAQYAGWLPTGVDTQKAVQTASETQPGLYAIDHFVDGDTIAVAMNGKTEIVRMIGIDTPETHKPHTPVQCYGPAAAAYTKHLIDSQKVRLESDPQSTNRDRYNRLLRYVYTADGTFVQKELLQNGYAFAYTQFPFTKSAEFSDLQNSAKQTNKGLWGNCNPYQQSNGRWQTNNAG